MANDQEKNILVDRGIPMLPDLGSSDRAGAGAGRNGSGSGSGWNLRIGNGAGRGAGPGGSGLGPGRGRRRGITNKQAKRLLRQQQAELAKAQAEAQALATRQAAEQAAAQARAQAEAQARAQAEAAERARVEAAASARAARAQAHRNAIETLTSGYPSTRAGLAHSQSEALRALPEILQREIDAGLERPSGITTGQQLQELIVLEKVRINLLLASRQSALESQQQSLRAFPQQRLHESTLEHYKNYLEQHSQGNPDLVRSADNSWLNALKQTYDVELLAEAIALLNEKNTALSMRHAELSHASDQVSQETTEGSESGSGAETLWSALFPASNVSSAPRSQTAAADIARKYFMQAATRRLSRHLGLVLAAFPRQLSDAELPATAVVTPLSQLGLPAHLDLEYVANANGTIDVPHRLVSESADTTQAPRWIAADGVKVGTKVRVRTFTHNPQNNTYEFIRDGESIPALIWTPITPSTDSSTVTPVQPPRVPDDPGISVAPVKPEVEVYPANDNADPDDYILISPPGSGLPDTYLLFKDPRSVPGIASGYGAPVSGTWLGAKTQAEGAPIPSHIADALRGERFASFSRLREAIWKAVASDTELSNQFTQRNLDAMQNASAPFSGLIDQVGNRKKFEIHHKHEVAQGGAVYDFDNLVIMTPRQHIEHHRSKKNDL